MSDDMETPDITVIGLGALGTVLCRALVRRGAELKSVFNRTPGKALEVVSSRNRTTVASSFPEGPDQLGGLVFLTVSDAAIAETAAKLSHISGDLSGKTFVHCSGNESAAVLDELKVKGARTASMHPLQTFSVHSVPADFNNIYFSLQGDPAAFPTLERIAGLLGARTLTVDERQKAHLHVAAVIASNYLITLIDASTETGSLGGMDKEQVREALYPLVQTSLKNMKSASFEEAVSGPIARGDIETVKHHLQLLEQRKELKAFYAALGLQTVEKAEETGKLEQAFADKLRALFKKAGND